jgi:cytochrome bd ubiquinol oxidase subunit I
LRQPVVCLPEPCDRDEDAGCTDVFKTMKRHLIIVLFLVLSASAVSAEALPVSAPPNSDRPAVGSRIQPHYGEDRDLYYNVKGMVSGPRPPRLSVSDYPELLGESRLVIWIVAQQHRYWVAFVLGTLLIVTLLEIWALIRPKDRRAVALDQLAREWLALVMLAISVAAILGGLLLFSLLALYPDLMWYLMAVFRPVFLIFGMLLLPFAILSYVYCITWGRWRSGCSKWLHATLGILVNVIGMTIAFLGNAWSAFMLSPAGVDASGRYLGNAWHAVHTALWNPTNLHRLGGQLLCASAVLAAYAVYRAIAATTDQERAHYDWMGAVAAGFLAAALFTMPFGGYWLMRETYAYRQQMGITLLGGLLAWLGVVLVSVMGLLFFGINYYLWQRIGSVGETHSFNEASKWVYALVGICMVVYITPHTMVMTPLELKNLHGQQHQVLGNYGVESAKSAAVNVMMLITTYSFVLWRMSHGAMKAHFRRLFRIITVVFIVAGMNILWLGIYGYYIPANVRVGLSVPMVGTTFTVMLVALAATTRLSAFNSEPGTEWGRLSTRGYFALVGISCLVIWIMGLGGYRRSALRLFWHINEVMQDESPWAFTHTTGFAVNVISMNALLFLFACAGLLWLSRLITITKGDYQQKGWTEGRTETTKLQVNL